ncbi:uncharacterized protein Bfra_010118 [Botrytis fragariae]|uniref:Uncharacterized protein n=1 Tax=Botrytis fragariae TaxID=1964551 RepID=A0A8H6EF90_9HELO|nr:uncharacterized protein Bfra_010118 [Botrytis fragariae]KAF5869973.1 hypothetical protein Bfra_010118 [Botrytis fragariae]
MTKKQESAIVKTPAESEEEKLIPMIMHSASPVPYQSRIPYDFNYYGDFYFASIAHREERLKAIHEARIGATCDNSGGTDDKIVTHQRQGLFRFTDLPAEIRKLIFQLIASTLLHFDPKSNIYSNHAVIETVADEGESSRSIGNTWGPRLDWAYLEWVRVLANVSMQFRLEFGSVIWERSQIYYYDVTRKSALGHFLTASPGITKGIEELVINITLEECLKWETSSDESIQSCNRRFQALIELISQKLDLECLTLSLSGTQSALFNLAEGEGSLKILRNIRDLKVTKGFQVEIRGYSELVEDGYDTYCGSDRQFKFTWEPKIREALLPNVLRPQRPKTDRNHYLASGAKEHEIGAIE